MKYFFSGSVEATADDKNRFRFPAKYRDCYVKKDGFNNEVVEEIYVLKTLNTNYITIFPKTCGDKFIEQLNKQIRVKDNNASNLARYYLTSMDTVKVDTQGRFTLKKNYNKFVLGKEVVILGVGSKLEVWNKEDYNAYMDNISNNLEDTTSVDDIVIGFDD